jgi:IclR family pca regulon transcriptional regulator
VRLEAHVGSRFPAYPTSMGRVLLAGLSPQRLDQYFEEAEINALTERTVTDRAKLRALIDECRRVGYSAVEDELAYGVVAVAVPVFDKTRLVVAALNSQRSDVARAATRPGLVAQRSDLISAKSAIHGSKRRPKLTVAVKRGSPS